MKTSACGLPFHLAPSLLGGLLLLTSCGRNEAPPAPAVSARGAGGFVAKAPVAGVDASEARTALVIGVGDYKDAYFQALDAPGEDARKIAEKLQTLGFEVTLKLNPGRNEMLTLTDGFGAALSRRQGVGLFYFSGHGCMKPDEADPNFLVPAGTHIGSREDLPQEAVNAQRVANRMKEAGNRLNLVFLDACRSNTLPSRTKAATGGLASMRGASGLMFFFATQPNEYALEARETHSSLFTDALLSHLATPGLSFMDMMADVTASTETASLQLTAGDTPFKQSPFMTGTLSGRFSFVPVAPVSPAPSPALASEKPKDDYFDLKWTQADIDRMRAEPGNIWKALELKPGTPPPDKEKSAKVVSKPSSATSLEDHGLKKSLELPLPGSLKLTFQSIPSGTFTMGSTEKEDGRSDDEKTVEVTLTKNFWLARTEFTQAQWVAVMGDNPSHFKGDDLPVDSVSWDDIQKCLAALNKKSPLPSGWTWSLPSEAQWEYACRAGTRTAFSFGDSLVSTKANFNGEYPYGTETKGPWLEKTTAPGHYPANDWGLVDMHGNLSEWCQDSWGGDPSSSTTDPLVSDGPYRVCRGGAWLDSAKFCRSAYHVRYTPDHRNFDLGFRVAAVPTGSR